MAEETATETTETTETPPEGTAPPPDSSVSPSDDAATSEPAASADDAPDGGATLVTGGDKEDPPQTAPSNWPENWREIMAGGDDRALKRLNRFNSPANVFKSWMGMDQKLNSGELLRSKPDGQDEEKLNEWRAQAGIPQKPEEYLENLPDGLVIGDDDKPLVEDFLKSMHESDATPDFVHNGLAWYFDTQERLAEQRAEKDRNDMAVNEDELRSEWGNDYRPNMNMVKNFFNLHSPEGFLDELAAARMPDGSLVGSHPIFLKTIASAAAETMPSKTITPVAGQTPLETIVDRKGQLENLMGDSKSEYWVGATADKLQEEYRELVDLEDKYKKTG